VYALSISVHSLSRYIDYLVIAFVDVAVFLAIHPRQSRFFSFFVLCLWFGAAMITWAYSATLACGLASTNTVLSLLIMLNVR